VNNSFAPILEVVDILRGFRPPWFVSGGWAIDLFLQRVTRPHADIEIGIYRRDMQDLWPRLPGWNLDKAIQTPEGGRWVNWERGEELKLPVHQIRASQLDPVHREFEFFLNESQGDNWKSRRHPGLMRPMGEVLMDSATGIRILVPEIQLLFKAKQTREKDQIDFNNTLPRLTQAQREWLKGALAKYHPEHRWMGMLGS